MPAQVDLDRRREPAQVELAVGARRDERGLGQVQLRATACIHASVGEAVAEQAHGRRVAGEGPVGERVDDR